MHRSSGSQIRFRAFQCARELVFACTLEKVEVDVWQGVGRLLSEEITTRVCYPVKEGVEQEVYYEGHFA
jgi:hypothetical protein